MNRTVIWFGALLMSAVPAMAGFQIWSSEIEEDPFSGGKRVTVSFMSSPRSGVVVICDSAEKGLMVRAIPGYAYSDSLSGMSTEIEFAFDGKRLLGQAGETGAVGDNLAVSQTMLSKENAALFVEAFAGATKQVAIKDGMSDRPHLMTARGSTKAGAALVTCMKSQAE